MLELVLVLELVVSEGGGGGGGGKGGREKYTHLVVKQSSIHYPRIPFRKLTDVTPKEDRLAGFDLFDDCCFEVVDLCVHVYEYAGCVS